MGGALRLLEEGDGVRVGRPLMSDKTYLVWEVEYAEEGSFEVRAKSPEAAKAKYRKDTGADSDVELGVDVLTPALRKIRAARALSVSGDRP